MTQQEFDDWLDYHESLYPALSKWLASQDNQVAVANSWWALFDKRNISLQEAKAASDTLNQSRTQPKGFGDHGRQVFFTALDARAESKREARMDAKPVQGVACGICDDSGYASVKPWGSLLDRMVEKYGDRVHSQLEEDQWWLHGYLRVTVACDCEVGDGKNWPMRLKRQTMEFMRIIERDMGPSPFGGDIGLSDIGVMPQEV